MAWVITRTLPRLRRPACVEVCPVDCIYTYGGEDKAPSRTSSNRSGRVHQLRRVRARVPVGCDLRGQQVPEVFQPDIALNAAIVDAKGDFSVP